MKTAVFMYILCGPLIRFWAMDLTCRLHCKDLHNKVCLGFRELSLIVPWLADWLLYWPHYAVNFKKRARLIDNLLCSSVLPTWNEPGNRKEQDVLMHVRYMAEEMYVLMLTFDLSIIDLLLGPKVDLLLAKQHPSSHLRISLHFVL